MPWFDGAFPEYQSVATRRARARAAAEKLARKQKRSLAPIDPISGNKLASTFWGKAWCHNLEAYSDYANRLPRGRSYVRHGAVIDLQIAASRVAALVSGSAIYEVEVSFQSLKPKLWAQLAADCATQIDSLVDLLRGKLPAQVMERVTRRPDGLFPAPTEISFKCSCPDWAGMCKHVAAALYGVGVRLEAQPELLFALRGVDHGELVGGAAGAATGLAGDAKERRAGGRKVIKGADLSALFGIELEVTTTESTAAAEVSGDGTSAKARGTKGGRAKTSNRKSRKPGKRKQPA